MSHNVVKREQQMKSFSVHAENEGKFRQENKLNNKFPASQ